MTRDIRAVIRIKSFRTPAHIGCTEGERVLEQALEFDLDLDVPTAHASGRTVDLNQSICYLELRNIVRDLVQSRHWVLIEEVCNEVLELIFAHYPLVVRANVTCRKFVLADCFCTEIQLGRERDESR